MKQLTLFLWLICFTVWSQPSTEIWLLDLKVRRNHVSASNPVDITKHPGYDNQPSFHPTQPLIYFSSAQEDGRTDIYSYNWNSGETIPITRTGEREYSPQITPDGKHLSCIIQRDNGAQDLGQYPVNGGEAQVLISSLTVGYHAWMDPGTLAVFVLGTPQTLQVVKPGADTGTTVAEKIGRSIHRIPGTGDVSFVDKSNGEKFMLRRLRPDLTIDEIGPAMPGNEDMCWLPDGRVLSSDGTSLWVMDTSTHIWTKIDGPSLKGITRVAVSPDGKKVAVVVTE